MTSRVPRWADDELIYLRATAGNESERRLVRRRDFVTRCLRWLPHHPEAFFMADGHLHRAICPQALDLRVFDQVIGAHKNPWHLIERAMIEWEGYLLCRECEPDPWAIEPPPRSASTRRRPRFPGTQGS